MRSTILLAIIGLVVPAFAQEPQVAKAPTWLTDFAAAKAAAKQQGKPIFAAFVGSDWCGWCIRLRDEVFSKPEFAEWSKQVVLLEIDFPQTKELPTELKAQNKLLERQYGIRSKPTVLMMDATGKQFGTLDYRPGGAKKWLDLADEQLAKGKPKDPAAATAVEWLTDYEKAIAKAKQENKVVLTNFTGSDWCGWCIKLKEEVFSKPEFATWAKEHAVLLELDFPRRKKLPDALRKQNEKLRDTLRPEGYPTICFLDAEGKERARTGYVAGGPAAWIASAEALLHPAPKGK